MHPLRTDLRRGGANVGAWRLRRVGEISRKAEAGLPGVDPFGQAHYQIAGHEIGPASLRANGGRRGATGFFELGGAAQIARRFQSEPVVNAGQRVRQLYIQWPEMPQQRLPILDSAY